MKKILNVRWLALIAAGILLSGCAAVGVLAGGGDKNYTGTYELKTDVSLDVTKKLDALAKQTDFLVTKSSKTGVHLQKDMAIAAAGLAGVRKGGEMVINGIGTKTLKIEILLVGNFDYGTKKNTDELFQKVAAILKN